MKPLFNKIGVVIVIVVLLVTNASYFIVSETEQCIITRFGKPVRDPIMTAGLHFKVPFLEKATRFEKRVLEWDGYPNQITTRDKKYILVDTTARWKIVDPLKYLQTVRGESGAQSRLDDIIDSATREAISRHNLVETVRTSNRIMDKIAQQPKEEKTFEPQDDDLGSERLAMERIKVGRDQLQKMILTHATPLIQEYGIELIDVRIKRLNFENSVQEKVFDRMISERKRIAEGLRSEGLGKRAEIEGEMKLELNKIESEAYRLAQEIKGGADAEATTIYAQAYQVSPDFFEFIRTMQTYEDVFNEKFLLLLSTNGELLSKINK